MLCQGIAPIIRFTVIEMDTIVTSSILLLIPSGPGVAFDFPPCLSFHAQEFLRMIALDGGDRISYAEFAVFVSDPDHAELQSKVCHQVSRQLGALGRRSFRLDEAFRQRQCWWSAAGTGARGRRADAQSKEGDHMFHESTEHRSEDKACRDRKEGYRQWQAVSASEFLDGLEILGLRLSATETERLLMRFDIHGDGHLSVGRFVSMIEKSPSWMCALDRLARQEEADEEADACLRAQRFSQGQPLNLEMVEMARYLGIRVSSDAHLLWIAADALAAPLPDGWVTQRTQEGMWFYHNEVTGKMLNLNLGRSVGQSRICPSAARSRSTALIIKCLPSARPFQHARRGRLWQ